MKSHAPLSSTTRTRRIRLGWSIGKSEIRNQKSETGSCAALSPSVAEDALASGGLVEFFDFGVSHLRQGGDGHLGDSHFALDGEGFTAVVYQRHLQLPSGIRVHRAGPIDQ